MKEQLEAAAKSLAQEIGKHNLTREIVCDRAKVSPGSFGYVTGMKFTEWLDSLDLPEDGHPLILPRAKPEHRKEQILQTAISLSYLKGYMNVTFDDIANELGVTKKLVYNYYKGVDDLRNDMMQFAIENSYYDLIAQGIVNKHPIALSADPELKTEALRITMMK